MMQVLFLSAHGTKEHIKRSYEVGANLFMTKPVDPERVLKNIDFTIQHEAPPLRHKRYTLEQLQQFEREGRLKAEAERLHKPKREVGSQRDEQRPTPASQSTPPPRPPASPPPSAARPAPQAPPPPLEPAPSGIIPRILAVDDDEELLKMLRLALSESFEVTTASNGLEAIERMVDYEPDLMLLDIMMPKMNGYQLLQSIRRNTFYRNLPVLVLSAKSSPKDREYAARLGATHFLAKPYKIAELLDLLAAEVQASGFAARPKRLTLFEIGEREYREQREKDDRRERMERQDQMHGIQNIIDQDQGKR